MLQFGLIKQIQCRQEFIGILHVNFLALLHDIVKINTIQGNPENALLFFNRNILCIFVFLKKLTGNIGKKGCN